MRKLSELYDCDSNVEVKRIALNSKEVEDGDLFVCTMGVTADRHDFIDEAISNGAVACVISKDVGDKSVPLIKVEDTNREFPYLCQRFYDYPDRKMKLIATTGTDGKTTLSTIIQHLIGEDICGYLGTNGVRMKDFHEHLINTTPDAHILFKYLDHFYKNGCKYVSLETSSEAFYRKRLTPIEFDISVFTNITPEHLNIHKTFENYLDCKLQLFRQTKKDGFCIINRDEEHFEQVKEASSGKVLTYGMNEDADMRIVDYKLSSTNTLITFKYLDKTFEVTSPLLALYNIYNLAAALLACLVAGFKLDDLLSKISTIKVEGRMEVIPTNSNYSVIVDFAHTPNAIKNILEFAKSIKHNRIIVVIGSAGGRDTEKRPVIGNVCNEYADYTIFTTDDPRNENPRDICNMMVRDIKDKSSYDIVLDRSEAVSKAINMAGDGDMVFLLCKGNEPYQITTNGYEPYSEMDEAIKAINNKK
ncbi:MAG: UDP-N-acetylmuramoyl-L-alanyl-D-glutamate--2,6-diaminopimelate ligase [Bacilli bacterium]|nr:UDP-N-acetylmuramoyl-L-alanyl-D-glutamate--2,6-diaminopimelate ligase [Bacilli bacterium]